MVPKPLESYGTLSNNNYKLNVKGGALWLSFYSYWIKAKCWLNVIWMFVNFSQMDPMLLCFPLFSMISVRYLMIICCITWCSMSHSTIIFVMTTLNLMEEMCTHMRELSLTPPTTFIFFLYRTLGQHEIIWPYLIFPLCKSLQKKIEILWLTK